MDEAPECEACRCQQYKNGEACRRWIHRSIQGRDSFLNQCGRGAAPGRMLVLPYGPSALDTGIKLCPCCRYLHGNIALLRDIHIAAPTVA